jgi:PAS domain S-box-containing protein
MADIASVEVEVLPGLKGYRSPQYRRLHGLPLDKETETHEEWLARVHPSDREETERVFRAALSGSAPFYEIEYRIIRPDNGQTRWIVARVEIERDHAGQAHRMVGIHADITALKQAQYAASQAERRQAFLAELGRALRDLDDPLSVQETASGLLGEYLGVNRVLYGEIDGDFCTIRRSFTREVRPITGPFPYALYGEELAKAYQRGETVAVRDIESDPRLSEADRQNLRRGEVAAFMGVMLMKRGRLVAAFGVHSRTVRNWTDFEVGLMRDVAERIWADGERARAEATRMTSEERYREVFRSLDQAFHIGEVITASEGKAADYTILDANPAWCRIAGVDPPQAISKRYSAVFPTVDQDWLNACAEAGLQRKPVHLERYYPARDAWYDVRLVPFGPPGSGQFLATSTDITSRKAAELAVRQSEQRQSFLLKLSDAIRTLEDPACIKKSVTRLLGEHLRADRCGYGDIDPKAEHVSIHTQWTAPGIERLSSRYRMDDFGKPFMDTLRAGRTLVVNDTASCDLTEGEDVRAKFRETGIRAVVIYPLLKDGRFVASLFVHQAEPRVWTEDEVALIAEAAERTWSAAERAKADRAADLSERRFRTMADTAPVLIWEADETGGIFGNRQYLEFFGIRAIEDLPGSHWINFGHPDDIPEYAEMYRRAFERRQPFTGTCRFKRRDGQYRWLRSVGQPLGEDRFVGCSIDITDALEAEAALRTSEERFQAIAGAIEDVFYITDLKANRLLYLSPGYERIWGRTVESLMNDLPSFMNALHPDDRQRFLQLKKNQLAGQPIVTEYRIFRPDGEMRWILDRSFPIGTNGERAAGIAADVTKRKEAEAALAETRERLAQFGEASLDVLWMREAQTLEWVYLSPAFERIYGLSREAALSGDTLHRWLELVLPEDRAAALANIEKVRQGSDAVFEYRIRRPDTGKVRWLRNTDFPIRDESGAVVRIGGIGQDITEEKRAAEQNATLLAELQHRVRNVLALVSSVAGQSANSSTSVADYRDRLIGRLEALARTQTILTREAGVGVDLRALIETEISAYSAQVTNLAISGPDLKLAPKAAEVLTLAVHELTTNAVKYGALRGEGGHLTVSWHVLQDRDEDMLQLNWVETGVSLKAKNPQKGFGTQLITQRVPYELDGIATLETEADGIRCRIEFPLTKGHSIFQTDTLSLQQVNE